MNPKITYEDDRESMDPNDYCFACHSRQAICVKLLEDGIKSHSFIGVCRNKSCFRYNDIAKMPSWEIVERKEDVLEVQAALNRARMKPMLTI